MPNSEPSLYPVAEKHNRQIRKMLKTLSRLATQNDIRPLGSDEMSQLLVSVFDLLAAHEALFGPETYRQFRDIPGNVLGGMLLQFLELTPQNDEGGGSVSLREYIMATQVAKELGPDFSEKFFTFAQVVDTLAQQ